MKKARVCYWQTTVSHQVVQQLEFLRCQMYRVSGLLHKTARGVKAEIADRDDVLDLKRSAGRPCPPQRRADARCQLTHVEWLDDVIVRARLKRFYLSLVI